MAKRTHLRDTTERRHGLNGDGPLATVNRPLDLARADPKWHSHTRGTVLNKSISP
jgi:hypothetical protein